MPTMGLLTRGLKWAGDRCIGLMEDAAVHAALQDCRRQAPNRHGLPIPIKKKRKTPPLPPKL
jgi:hypothetical protein